MDSERVVQWMKDISNLFITFHGLYSLYQSRNSPCLIRTICPLLNQILQKNVSVTTMKILSRFSHGMVNLLNKESYLLKANKKVQEVLKSAIYEDDIIVEFSLTSKKRKKESENISYSENLDPIQKFKTLLNDFFTNAKEIELPVLFETELSTEIYESDDAIPLSLNINNLQKIKASTNKNLQCTNVTNFISNLCELKNNFQSKIMISKTWESRLPNYSTIPKDLFHNNIYDILEKMKITQLYSHQILALNALIKQKKNVIITTSTASGKSLCYILSLINASLSQLCPSALLLFPTKALAQDQYKNIQNWIISANCDNDLKITCFDGDTPTHSRHKLRVNSSVFLINPDILHVTILPNHKDWANIFRRCHFIVIDESHMYKGIFGIHVACILRRLRRLIRFYGGDPQFIVCSATMSQPLHHATSLTGLSIDEFTLVDEDGSPCGAKEIVLFNPIIGDSDDDGGGAGEELSMTRDTDNEECNGNSSTNKVCMINSDDKKKKKIPKNIATKLNSKTIKKTDTTDYPATFSSCNPNSSFPSECTFPSTSNLTMTPLARSQSPYHCAVTMIQQLVLHNIRSLVFVKARHIAELILEMTQAVLPSDFLSRVSTYRGGYLSTERREIEVNLKSGQLIVVIATNALEVGIDVGLLDCTLHLGYPGSTSSFRQQAGRAGRTGRNSLAVYLALHSPLEQFYMNNPNFFFDQQIDHICINVSNAIVLSEHLQCAAYEHPFMWEPLPTTSTACYAVTDEGHKVHCTNSSFMKQRIWNKVSSSSSSYSSSSPPPPPPLRDSEPTGEDARVDRAGLTPEQCNASDQFITSVMNPSEWFGDSVHQVLQEMLREGKLHSLPTGLLPTRQLILLPSSDSKSHASEVSIRGVDSHRTVTVVVDTSTDKHCLPSYYQNSTSSSNNNRNKVTGEKCIQVDNIHNIYEKEIETMEYSAALLWLYEGAVYLHRGRTYRVASLDLSGLKAVVVPCSVNYYTEHLGHLSVNVTRTDETVTVQYGNIFRYTMIDYKGD